MPGAQYGWGSSPTKNICVSSGFVASHSVGGLLSVEQAATTAISAIRVITIQVAMARGAVTNGR